jgi:hypothetical protein
MNHDAPSHSQSKFRWLHLTYGVLLILLIATFKYCVPLTMGIFIRYASPVDIKWEHLSYSWTKKELTLFNTSFLMNNIHAYAPMATLRLISWTQWSLLIQDITAHDEQRSLIAHDIVMKKNGRYMDSQGSWEINSHNSLVHGKLFISSLEDKQNEWQHRAVIIIPSQKEAGMNIAHSVVEAHFNRSKFTIDQQSLYFDDKGKIVLTMELDWLSNLLKGNGKITTLPTQSIEWLKPFIDTKWNGSLTLSGLINDPSIHLALESKEGSLLSFHPNLLKKSIDTATSFVFSWSGSVEERSDIFQFNKSHIDALITKDKIELNSASMQATDSSLNATGALDRKTDTWLLKMNYQYPGNSKGLIIVINGVGHQTRISFPIKNLIQSLPSMLIPIRSPSFKKAS